jgi:hypothetical protein
MGFSQGGCSQGGWCAGLDWGGASHAVAVVDERGRLVDQFTVAHSADGLVELERRLAKLAPPALIPIAIERPSGLLVDRLVEAGHPLVPIHPNVVPDRFLGRPAGRVIALRLARAIRAMPTCSPTSCAPMATASGP